MQSWSALVNEKLAVVASQSCSVAQSIKFLIETRQKRDTSTQDKSKFDLETYATELLKRTLLACEIMEQKLDQLISAVTTLTERLTTLERELDNFKFKLDELNSRQ